MAEETPLTASALLEQAFEQSWTEQEKAFPAKDEEAMPAESEEVPDLLEQAEADEPTVEGQVESESEESTDLFADVEEETEEEQVALDWDTPYFELPGVDSQVSLRELTSGYLRQSDYTRKTQALSEAREAFQKDSQVAANLWDSLQQKPAETVAWLAVQAGLLPEDQVGQALAGIEGLKFPKAEELETEIERRVAERLQSHPELQNAALNRQTQAIWQEFAVIEQELGRKLSENDQRRVLEYASANGVPNVRVAFNALWAEQQRTAAKRDALRKTATEKPKARGVERTTHEKPSTVDDAFERAWAQHVK